ncbi:MAG: GNAT family N-acetyltransferase [Candidatus Hodarchaeales archaeon]|jgi:ribosomal protein S18 acetylase RimI-like enzyme
MVVTFSLRPGTPEDLDFLFYLKEQTIKEYVTQTWGWDDEFQYSRHRKNVNPESYLIIQVAGKDIGCLEIENRPEVLFLSVIEILPAYQSQGIGRALIKYLFKQGKQEQKTIELQVLKVNQRAFHLYKCLGFIVTMETETHHHMIYQDSLLQNSP